jgi:HEAT repeat protein
LSATKPEIRAFALRKLLAAGKLRKADAVRLLNDEVYGVRTAAIDSILKAQWQVPIDDLVKAAEPPEKEPSRFEEKRRLLERIYSYRPSHELLDVIDWFKTDSHSAYAAWVNQHFDEAGATVRADLENRFVRLKDLGLERVRTQFGDDAVSVFEEEWAGFEEMFVDELAEAALRALAEHGDSDDVDLVRNALSRARYRSKEAAVEALRRLGDASDAETLVDLADDSSVGEMAARAALELSPGANGAAAVLVDHDRVLVSRAAVRSLRGDKTAESLVRPLLWHKTIQLRKEAVAYMCSVMNRAELVSLLEEYDSSPTYFYNVPHWIDRFLYAKGNLGKYFRLKLEA